MAGDLQLEVGEAAPVTFAHLQIAENSCEMYEGCAGGPGRRSVIQIQVSVRNIGSSAIALGRPWDSAYFHPSLCQQTNTIFGFIDADLLDATGNVITSGSLSTNCVADRDGGYTCMSQGLGPNGTAQQPEGACDYLDVTGVSAGDYRLRLTVNPSDEIPEANRNNNTLEIPVAYPACEGEICAGACCPLGVACIDNQCALPDLRVNAESAAESLWLNHETFGEDSCEIEEQCVSGSGRRRLLNFEGRIENWGPGDLAPGPERDNPLFEYSACHDHYHFRDFTDYQLLDQSGAVVAQGHKQSFCLVDMAPVETPSDPAPPGTRPLREPTGEGLLGPGEPHGGCNYLSAGWADIYGVGTPCQWVDVTDVPPGNYVLQLSVNPLGRVAESDLTNNTVQIPVELPEDLPCNPQPEICFDAIDQDCDEQPDAWDADCFQGGCFPGDPFCESPPTQVSGNDSCATAFELAEAGPYGGTLGAAAGENTDCEGEGAPAYFRFELEREQAVYLGTLGSQNDTVLSLYRDDCGAEPIRCADDDCGGRSGHFVDILPAGTYVAAVKSKRAGTAGSYRLRFEHDDPRGARVISHPGIYVGDTSTSLDEVRACSDIMGPEFGGGPDDIYLLASCNSPVTVSTCGSTTFHTALEVREIDSTFQQVQCTSSEDSWCAADELGATLTAYTQSSGMMFVIVDGERSDDSGEYQVSISY